MRSWLRATSKAPVVHPAEEQKYGVRITDKRIINILYKMHQFLFKYMLKNMIFYSNLNLDGSTLGWLILLPYPYSSEP